MGISEYISNLVVDQGIYFAKYKSDISYPESGNEDSFQLEDNSFGLNIGINVSLKWLINTMGTMFF